ncbi:BHLH domain-containing protein [Mycena kentingensis (nom. inval.)]|nr:BHLH domain-containing protein [Mycena kentingensis (nom. inval.)]
MSTATTTTAASTTIDISASPLATSTNNNTTTDANNTTTNTTPVKRPSRRRAPTAERRATHNAVERARRETLNGRFLALASLLPPLRVMRRPSKSAIVTSSIATVHAARRHRVLAAQTLKGMIREAEALRREVNEWRTRARIPLLESPMRTEAQDAVLRGEVEELDIDLDVAGEFDDEGDIPEEGDEQDEEDGNMKEEHQHDVKPQVAHINTSVKQIQLPQSQGRFAYDTPVSPLSAISMPPSMPSPPATMALPVSMPSPGGSDASWEAPRTPPTVYPQHTYPTQPQQSLKNVGAGYDLGLGLFDAGYAAEYGQGYNPGMMGMPMGMANSGGGWAAVNPAHPAYHGHQAAQGMGMGMYGLAPGQYLHQQRAGY